MIQSLINKVKAVIEERREQVVGSIDFMAELGKVEDFYLQEADSTDEEEQVKSMLARKKTFITHYFQGGQDMESGGGSPQFFDDDAAAADPFSLNH